MFTMSRAAGVNDQSDPTLPVLTRDHVWRGLVLFRGEPARERVTFFPKSKVQFERSQGPRLGPSRTKLKRIPRVNPIEDERLNSCCQRFFFLRIKEMYYAYI